MSGEATVELFVRDLGGEGRSPLVILHGLYGSSRNWVTVGRALADRFHVLAADLRNHGQSPHRADMRYPALVADVLAALDRLGLERTELMGHSLGGKVAMALACRAGERVRRLYVLDIAPREYAPDAALLDALLAVDLTGVERRGEVDERLADAIPDRELRMFLLTNLVRAGGRYTWQIDLRALRDAVPDIRANPLRADDRFAGPTLFLAGGRSGYVTADDRPAIERHFPRARLAWLEGVGHNVHTEGGDAFVRAVFAAAGAAAGGAG
ncbi:MAG TPA: alpha/beta fold hydrolase [Thermoanaerobaculia bacterium]|nr:alpha/beta fold hydrolase [Thermoanaerobaculia bacterium]